jgi:predicted RNA methylase
MKIWSDVEYVYRCLADHQRTSAFQSAIQAVVKPGDVVLDLGSGSGIMAIFAARAGARKIYSVEIGAYLSQASAEIFQRNGYGTLIIPLRMDARDVSLRCVDKPDVVICEMITTGFFGEMHGPVINALKGSGVIDRQTRLVPAALSTSMALVSADFAFYGADLRFPIFADYFTRSFDKKHEILSAEKSVHRVEFASDFSENVRIGERLKALKSGCANGLLLKSHTDFAGGTKLGACISYCQPVILPIRELPLAEGDTVAVALEYHMSEGFDTMECEIKRK